jgi:hypothetical protein
VPRAGALLVGAVLVAGGESGEDGSMVGEDRVSFTVG